MILKHLDLKEVGTNIMVEMNKNTQLDPMAMLKNEKYTEKTSPKICKKDSKRQIMKTQAVLAEDTVDDKSYVHLKI